MSEHVVHKRPKTHYHPTEGYAYRNDMTPTTDWELVSKIPLPEGRFFNEEELHEIFVLAHRLTPENIDLMKKWDRDNNRPDRFKPHHNGFPEWRNLSIVNSLDYSKEEKKELLMYLTGEISSIEYEFTIFKRALKLSFLEK